MRHMGLLINPANGWRVDASMTHEVIRTELEFMFPDLFDVLDKRSTNGSISPFLLCTKTGKKGYIPEEIPNPDGANIIDEFSTRHLRQTEKVVFFGKFTFIRMKSTI